MRYKWYLTYHGKSDYGFGIPSLPWVNGRDFAGIVVKTGRSVTKVKAGDVVRLYANKRWAKSS